MKVKASQGSYRLVIRSGKNKASCGQQLLAIILALDFLSLVTSTERQPEYGIESGFRLIDDWLAGLPSRQNSS